MKSALDHEREAHALSDTDQAEGQGPAVVSAGAFAQGAEPSVVIQVDAEVDHHAADPQGQPHEIRGECRAVVLDGLHVVRDSRDGFFRVIGKSVQRLELILAVGDGVVYAFLGGADPVVEEGGSVVQVIGSGLERLDPVVKLNSAVGYLACAARELSGSCEQLIGAVGQRGDAG